MKRIVLLAVYYLAVIGGTVALALLYPESVVLDLSSAVPVGVSALMLWQAYNLHTGKGFVSGGGNDAEVKIFLHTLSASYVALAPLTIPLIPFLDFFGKCISVLPFFLAIFIGSAVYKAGRKKRDAAAAEGAEAEPLGDVIDETDEEDSCSEENESEGDALTEDENDFRPEDDGENDSLAEDGEAEEFREEDSCAEDEEA